MDELQKQIQNANKTTDERFKLTLTDKRKIYNFLLAQIDTQT